MATFITVDESGDITAYADWLFPDSIEVDFEVVRGWDGKLYKAGTEPVEPESTPVDIAPVIITSDNITIADAELLMDAANAGEKTAIWLINKLEL